MRGGLEGHLAHTIHSMSNEKKVIVNQQTDELKIICCNRPKCWYNAKALRVQRDSDLRDILKYVRSRKIDENKTKVEACNLTLQGKQKVNSYHCGIQSSF